MAQGHSVSGVAPLLRPKMPPIQLFHGAIAPALPSIGRNGLRPMKRHLVHLSPEEPAAKAVGARRGAPVVLVSNAARMDRNRHNFLVADN